jgi:hypothetical protein
MSICADQHPEWGTLIFNYGRHEVRNFLEASAFFWAREYHADGIRVDGVASMLYLDYSRREGEWVPNVHGGREDLEAIAFIQELNEILHRREPGVIAVAEESTAWAGVSRPTFAGGLRFGFKWNMGWMHDTLGYFQHDPVYRSHHHHELTFSLLYAYTENFILPVSHDEVVHGKRSLYEQMSGDRWQKLANLRALYGYMWAHPGKKLLFMGANWRRTRSGATSGQSTGTCWSSQSMPVSSVSCATSIISYAMNRLSTSRISIRPVSGGLSRTMLRQTCLPSRALRAAAIDCSCARPTSPRFRARITASDSRAPATGSRFSTPTRPTTAAPMWGTQRWRRNRSRGTGSPARPR